MEHITKETNTESNPKPFTTFMPRELLSPDELVFPLMGYLALFLNPLFFLSQYVSCLHRIWGQHHYLLSSSSLTEPPRQWRRVTSPLSGWFSDWIPMASLQFIFHVMAPTLFCLDKCPVFFLHFVFAILGELVK